VHRLEGSAGPWAPWGHAGELSWLVGVVGFLAGIALSVEPVTALGLAAVAFSAAWYLGALGEEIAVVPLAALIASMQWILGPAIAYRMDDQFTKYRMYVPEAEYMRFVVPALLAFILSLSWISPRISVRRLQARIRSTAFIPDQTIFALIIVGLLADYFGDAAPTQVGFVFFLVGQFKYVGAIYLVAIQSRWRWHLVLAVMLLTAISSARTGLFHDLILWSALFFSFLCYDLQLRVWSKLAIIVASLAVLIGLQSVKAEYRMLLSSDPESAGIITLTSSIGEALFGDNENYDNTIARLNQGWIISAVMAYTPNVEPFADGQTVIDAVRDSLLPRLLSDKPEVEVSDHFRRFTGLSVSSDTSFGISIVGEAWANFGQLGIVLLLFWGLVFGGLTRLIAQFSLHQPTLPLWTPMIFLYAVKAETELVVTLNYMVKACAFVFLLYFLTWWFLKYRI
jgi:hypothetical protein